MFELEGTEFVTGIYFGEAPRWHDGSLYFSDFYAHKVFKVDLDGSLKEVVTIANQPSGLGWLPDGSMLVVSMIDRKIYRYFNEALELYADIGEFATFHANDMVVSESGYVYVGNFGFDLDEFIEQKGLAALVEQPGPPKANLVVIDPDTKSPSIAWPSMDFPNGMVITPDGSTLIVAESLGMRLTAFDIANDGSLSNKRTWADLSPYLCAPDGICLDENGDIWVANAIGNHCLLVEEGGTLKGKVTAPMNCFACMLGGDDGKWLYYMSAPTSNAVQAKKEKNGIILKAHVYTPRAGLP